MRLPALLLLLLLALPAAADVYRWVDADGVTHYSDKPPTKDAKPADLPPLQTFDPHSMAGGQGQSYDEPDSKPAASGLSFHPVITSPAADQTFRGDERDVTVMVSSAPPNGVGLLYYLDGSAQFSVPTSETTLILPNVERGEHQVSVAAVDTQGHEVGRSAPVRFFMKPVSVHH